MPAIILSTLNARFIHASLGLRYLLANLGELRGRALLREFTIARAATEIVDELLLALDSLPDEGERLQIIGFGSFYTKLKPARTAINPNTRKPVQVPEKKLVKFAPGKALREAVNKK